MTVHPHPMGEPLVRAGPDRKRVFLYPPAVSGGGWGLEFLMFDTIQYDLVE